jgi:hypothetical protein
MGLSEIAAGIETTTRQRDRGVAAVDATGSSLAERLAAFDDELPCEVGVAATILQEYVGGGSVGASARAADVPPITAAKTLHLLGVEGICPLSPAARGVVRDYLDARLTRTEAETLADAEGATFALAAFVETHDPIPGARDAVEEGLSAGGDAMVEKRAELGDALDRVTDHR